jgi:hypothetical protein
MTIALTSAGSVKQGAMARLSSLAGQAAGTISSATARRMFATFFESLAMDQGNWDLQLVSFGDIGSGITTAVTEACRVYAVYGQKQAASGTDSWLKIRDNATDMISLPFTEANKEAYFFSPTGVPLATSLKLEAHTDSTGSTDSTATHGPQGFVIIGGAAIGA